MKADNVYRRVIQPEEAITLLKNKARNRKLRRRFLDRLGSDLRNARWRLTGEPIIIDNYGKLIDGQHRLTACVETGIPIEVYVVEGGIAEDAQGHIDTGIARNPGEALHIVKNVPNAVKLAASIRWIYRYHNEDMELGIKQLSRHELFELVDKMPEVERSFIPAAKLKKFLPPSLCVALHYLMAQKDAELADIFFEEVSTGSAIGATDPVYLLREALIKNKLRHSRYSTYHMTALTIKVWNAIRSGRRNLKRLTWYPNNGEPFPKIG